MNTAALLSGHARRIPHRPALLFEDRVTTFAELETRANRVARALVGTGVTKGSAVALYTSNRLEWVEVFFAASRIGAILVPVNFRLRATELRDVLSRARPLVLLFEAELAPEVDKALASGELPPINLVEIGGRSFSSAAPYEVLISEAAGSAPKVEILGDDHHSICYTSGTTGAPKGAILTHDNVVIGTHYMSLANIGYTRDDVFLNPTPLCHRAGWARLIQSVGVGAPHVLVRRFDPERVLTLMREHHVTMIGLVPTMVRLIEQVSAAPQIASLRRLLTTGEACPPAIKETIFSLFPGVELITTFASTEAGIIALSSSADPGYDPAATGRPLNEVELRVLDENGVDLPPGEVGEIVVRAGPPGRGGIMLGYHEDPDANREAFAEGGWFHTGDCGYLEESGLLYMADRKKDMILSGGLNIYSKEVEKVLLQHPAVQEAAVVARPDATWGESVVAFVVSRRGVAADARELIAHCKEHLASYKKPREVIFLDELPRNAAGKTLKYQLRERARSGKGASD